MSDDGYEHGEGSCVPAGLHLDDVERLQQQRDEQLAANVSLIRERDEARRLLAATADRSVRAEVERDEAVELLWGVMGAPGAERDGAEVDARAFLERLQAAGERGDD